MVSVVGGAEVTHVYAMRDRKVLAVHIAEPPLAELDETRAKGRGLGGAQRKRAIEQPQVLLLALVIGARAGKLCAVASEDHRALLIHRVCDGEVRAIDVANTEISELDEAVANHRRGRWRKQRPVQKPRVLLRAPSDLRARTRKLRAILPENHRALGLGAMHNRQVVAVDVADSPHAEVNEAVPERAGERRARRRWRQRAERVERRPLVASRQSSILARVPNSLFRRSRGLLLLFLVYRGGFRLALVNLRFLFESRLLGFLFRVRRFEQMLLLLQQRRGDGIFNHSEGNRDGERALELCCRFTQLCNGAAVRIDALDLSANLTHHGTRLRARPNLNAVQEVLRFGHLGRVVKCRRSRILERTAQVHGRAPQLLTSRLI